MNILNPVRKLFERNSGQEPDVILDFVFDKGLFFIEIKNIGTKPAYDINIIFDKKFSGVSGNKVIPELSVFRSLSFLPPGKVISIFMDHSEQYFERKEPAIITSTIEYKDQERHLFKRNIRHNLEIYKDMIFLL